MNINLENTSKKLCVIGDPVLHSKSPLIHNSMIQALGLDYLYLCQPVTVQQTASFLEAAKLLGYAGFNATMPHKEYLLPLMDELDEDAQLYGAVNTVAIQEGKAYGYNTDGRGFYASLLAEGVTVQGKQILLLGAGGAAKAVALKLVQQGAEQVTISNRSIEKAELLCLHSPDHMRAVDFQLSTLCQETEQADLLVNCTSLGMGGTQQQFTDLSFLSHLKDSATVCDLIYYPSETMFLQQARELGHPTINGLGMLVYQAIFALEYMINQPLDTKIMAEVARKALKLSQLG